LKCPLVKKKKSSGNEPSPFCTLSDNPDSTILSQLLKSTFSPASFSLLSNTAVEKVNERLPEEYNLALGYSENLKTAVILATGEAGIKRIAVQVNQGK
jgi:hypothetical protein